MKRRKRQKNSAEDVENPIQRASKKIKLDSTQAQRILQNAFKEENSEVIEWLKKEGLVNLSDSNLSIKSIELMILLGFDINAKDKKNGDTPLIKAVKEGGFCKVKSLVDYGADTSISNKQYLSALWYAIKLDHSNIANILLDKGENGSKEFIHAAREQDYQSMELLISLFANRGLDIEAIILSKAVDEKDYKTIDLLQENGLDVINLLDNAREGFVNKGLLQTLLIKGFIDKEEAQYYSDSQMLGELGEEADGFLV